VIGRKRIRKIRILIEKKVATRNQAGNHAVEVKNASSGNLIARAEVEVRNGILKDGRIEVGARARNGNHIDTEKKTPRSQEGLKVEVENETAIERRRTREVPEKSLPKMI
jgi:hypothetical protein